MRKTDYSALVASATAQQATSRTISALLSVPRVENGVTDVLGGRIAFFAQASGSRANGARGAFWIYGPDQGSQMPNKMTLPVNLAGSTKGNLTELETVEPELQVAEWGTEL